ncbi:hypothetical protein QYS49_38750 [Marivirga salinae]|uniref:Uncharacterized protein n=1 Tax=Marivirga salinarum TaxID=3059078 RepID=A0AA51REE3_9BACT|nr:hypothetical protein [Marivirga sp. BDSF4-3]WMN11535.1 hypothetical protein QYS49_38750 [Marivirga sp. BDSF4-3]
MFTAQTGFSQIDEPLIERKGNLVQNRYFILGEEVSERQVLKKMLPFEAAHKRMKSSRRWAFTSAIIAGFGVGTFLPTFFDPSPEITVPLLITGISLIAIALPLKSLANRKADEAIDLYNSRKIMGYKKSHSHINFTFNQYGIGLNLKF